MAYNPYRDWLYVRAMEVRAILDQERKDQEEQLETPETTSQECTELRLSSIGGVTAKNAI